MSLFIRHFLIRRFRLPFPLSCYPNLRHSKQRDEYQFVSDIRHFLLVLEVRLLIRMLVF